MPTAQCASRTAFSVRALQMAQNVVTLERGHDTWVWPRRTEDLHHACKDRVRSGTHVYVLGTAPFGWFAAPGTFASSVVSPLCELAGSTVIEQSANSIITELCARLWEDAGVHPERIYGGNNVNALAGLISAGVGVSCRPIAMFTQEIERNQLQLVKTTPAAPEVPYLFVFCETSMRPWVMASRILPNARSPCPAKLGRADAPVPLALRTLQGATSA